jgi:seryl-tRNA synthetase
VLDIKRIRKNPQEVKNLLLKRGLEWADTIDELLKIDEDYRIALQEQQALEAKRNELSKAVGHKKSKGENADSEITDLNQIKKNLQNIADKQPLLAAKQEELLLSIPNMPYEDVPSGSDDTHNQEVFRWGEPRNFDFEAKEHDDIAKALGILDFDRGVKIAQSRFTLLRGGAAKLERALINFMLDMAASKGYEEILPPILVNSGCLYGTGQLPKFKEQFYKVENEDLYLIPTAEVPLTNIYRDEILAAEQLPMSICAFTPCFRSEAGAASKDTRGIIRQHQFNKIELVKISKPEDSLKDHEKLTSDAESILQALRLPYRKMLLCTGDMGFSAAKCYDLEVWFHGQRKYREISSCSNFSDFQARRAKIRFKQNPEAKAELVHTVNGSGLAVGRTLAAILENYQNADGSVTIPELLVPYMKLEKLEFN